MVRFTIRDVLWLTLVAGLAVAFCIQAAERARFSGGNCALEIHVNDLQVELNAHAENDRSDLKRANDRITLLQRLILARQ